MDRTLLERLIRRSDHTIEEWCAIFDATAQQLGERITLSSRQLQRWMAGQVDNARPAARRVAQEVWDSPFAGLLSRPSEPSVTDVEPGHEVGSAVRGSPLSSESDLNQWEMAAVMAANESSQHSASAGGGISPATVEQIQADVLHLAQQYASTAPIILLAQARQCRDLTYAALDRTHRPAQTTDLYLAAGQLCALMSLASFDLAIWDAAATQARAAHVYAEVVDHPGLRSWAKGTQALIEYWSGRPRNALVHVEAGLQGCPPGAGLSRLRAIQARALSQLGGDPGDLARAISSSDAALATATGQDDLYDHLGGKFGWGPSRQAACVGTALLNAGDAAAAAERARTAIALAAQDPASGLVRERAHLDLACADLALGGLDAAVQDLDPVWEVPPAHRRHALTGRLLGLSRDLTAGAWARSPAAVQLRDRIEVFTSQAERRGLPSA